MSASMLENDKKKAWGAQKVSEKKKKLLAEEAAKCGKITDLFGKSTTGSSTTHGGGAAVGPAISAACC